MPTVFLTYRHEDVAHRAHVCDLAVRLEAAGLTVVLDQFAQQRTFRGGGPNEGWPRWSKAQAGNPAHKVLIIASAGWFKCYEGKELPGTGLGAAAEASVIEQRLYNTAGVNPDIRIVTFAALDPTTLPLDLQRPPVSRPSGVLRSRPLAHRHCTAHTASRRRRRLARHGAAVALADGRP